MKHQRTIPNDFPATVQVQPVQKTRSLGWAIGDPLHAMYGEHAKRAQAEGFKQMPYGEYRLLHRQLYWGAL